MMVEFILFVPRPELFAQEISHIRSILLLNNTRSSVITNSDQLLGLLPQLGRENSVIILFATGDEELDGFIYLKEYFGAIPTILVLPDDNPHTLQRGMLLNPLCFMAKHAELSQFCLTINELCHIYADHSCRSGIPASRTTSSR